MTTDDDADAWTYALETLREAMTNAGMSAEDCNALNIRRRPYLRVIAFLDDPIAPVSSPRAMTRTAKAMAWAYRRGITGRG